MRIIRAVDLVSQPWPNGLGNTCPIHAEAEWQISVADLDGEARFSLFEEQDRVFTLLEGGGAALDLAERGSQACHPLVPVHFPGDVPTRYRPATGPARAFNVIASRAVLEAEVTVASLAGAHAISGGGTAAVFCVSGKVTVGDEALGSGDTALHTGARPIEACTPATVILVRLLGRAEGFCDALHPKPLTQFPANNLLAADVAGHLRSLWRER